MDKNYKYMFKIIMIGDAGVGKTTLMFRYLYEKFLYAVDTTIGVEFGSKITTVENVPVKLQLWDTSGQEKFRSITRCYYRGAAGCLLVYDITSWVSFSNILAWLSDYQKMGSHQQTEFVLVGTKNDLKEKRAVSYEEAKTFAHTHNMRFFETSSKEDVSEIFQFLGAAIYHKRDAIGVNTDTGIKLNQRLSEKKNRCCFSLQN
jgi:small GTP-binding protein